MARIDDLLRRIPDAELRADLTAAVAEVRRARDFGLVYESHLPETCRLYSHPIRRGVKAAERSADDNTLYLVVSVNGSTATLLPLRDANDVAVAADEQVAVEMLDDALVVVAEFGDPIHPGLKRVGSLDRGGDRPAHVVINGENHHALEALQFTHAGKVDCIYIDPPYNTENSDWTYNNDYVDANDTYRHSKWLAMMERRLKLARQLLRPERSVLIVTIGQDELHRLGLLLEQSFPDAATTMVTSVVNPRGKYQRGDFAPCEEYLFVLRFGTAQVLGEPDADGAVGSRVSWRTLRRSDLSSRRGTKKGGPRQFFPIFVEQSSKRIKEIGVPLSPDVDRTTISVPTGCVAVFPVRDDGTEMNWGLIPESLEELRAKGYVRVGRATPDKPQTYEISYLTEGRISDIESGRAKVTGYEESGAVVATYEEDRIRMPVTTWHRPSHNAETGGTSLLKALLGDKIFDYPKSLYAVEDILRLFVSDNPDAVVLDFFAGSGTTAHAVMRLNHQDGGFRQSLLVTNNEVGKQVADSLAKAGLAPGDEGWEASGIFSRVTRPRIEAAVTGVTHSGEPIAGEYAFVDAFPMADGFEENVEFFELTYQDAASVELDLVFDGVAPLLWMRAGGQGSMIEHHEDVGFAWAEGYGVLWDTDRWHPFVAAAPETATTAFVVTNSATVFAAVAAELPADVEPVRLYANYLTTCAINQVEPS